MALPLTRKFLSHSLLDFEDQLIDEPWYDGGRHWKVLPALGDLREVPAVGSLSPRALTHWTTDQRALVPFLQTTREVIIVDMATDHELREWVQSVHDAVQRLLPASSHTVARLLSTLVATRLGGPGSNAYVRTAEAHVMKVKRAVGSVAVPLGRLSGGTCRHRAVLFKLAADAVGLPARLVRGTIDDAWGYCWNIVPSNLEAVASCKGFVWRVSPPLTRRVVSGDDVTPRSGVSGPLTPSNFLFVDSFLQPGEAHKCDSAAVARRCPMRSGATAGRGGNAAAAGGGGCMSAVGAASLDCGGLARMLEQIETPRGVVDCENGVAEGRFAPQPGGVARRPLPSSRPPCRVGSSPRGEPSRYSPVGAVGGGIAPVPSRGVSHLCGPPLAAAASPRGCGVVGRRDRGSPEGPARRAVGARQGAGLPLTPPPVLRRGGMDVRSPPRESGRPSRHSRHRRPAARNPLADGICRLSADEVLDPLGGDDSLAFESAYAAIEAVMKARAGAR